MVKRISLGCSEFKRIIEDDYYFVDKSLFIKEIVEDGSAVLLLPRPRRFGKTLNMSMVKYFFEKTKESNRGLFKYLNIYKHKDIMEKQGKNPVIFISFKDVKDRVWENCYLKMIEIIRKEYDKNKYVLEILSENEKQYYNNILFGNAKKNEYESSLKNLTEFLTRFNQERTVVIIDEYDAPIQSGYLNDYYDRIIEFMRNFLSGGLKDNEYLEKGILTGILRVAKESIFSGLNNINVCTILSLKYSKYFGFTEEEIIEVLKYYKVQFNIDEIRNWYNGYIFGNNTIYNPWSVLNYICNWQDGFKPYWTNTSSNDLVKMLVTKGGQDLKKDLEKLIKGESIEKNVNEDIVMGEIDKGTENVWSFLLFSGYLKVVKKTFYEGELLCNLKIPNKEVKYLYRQIILGWFRDSINNDEFKTMLRSLVSGDVKTFGKIFKNFVKNSMSYFDTAGKDSEKVYHAFVLGMLIGLGDEYEVKSNRESGYGRYDVMVIPKDENKIGIIIEFKKVEKDENEDLEIAANEALVQIKDREYKAELIQRGVKNIIELGIAFDGKSVLIKSC